MAASSCKDLQAHTYISHTPDIIPSHSTEVSPLPSSAFYLLHSWFKKSKRVNKEIRVSLKQGVLIYFSEDSGL